MQNDKAKYMINPKHEIPSSKQISNNQNSNDQNGLNLEFRN